MILPDNLVISQAVAPLYGDPSFLSQMVTQGLLWEPLQLIEKKGSWWKVKVISGYDAGRTGWIHSKWTQQIKPNK